MKTPKYIQNFAEFIKNLNKENKKIKYVWGCYFETSINRFVKINKNGYTPIRRVCEFEIEVYNSDGGINIINEREIRIKRRNVLVAFPETGDKASRF